MKDFFWKTIGFGSTIIWAGVYVVPVRTHENSEPFKWLGWEVYADNRTGKIDHIDFAHGFQDPSGEPKKLDIERFYPEMIKDIFVRMNPNITRG
jgi:hypothetical protein